MKIQETSRLKTIISIGGNRSRFFFLLTSLLIGITEVLVLVSISFFVAINTSNTRLDSLIGFLQNYIDEPKIFYNTLLTLIVICGALLRIVLTRVQMKLIFTAGEELTIAVISHMLNMPYESFKKSSLSELLNYYTTHVNNIIYNIYIPLGGLVGSIITAFFIIVFLVLYNWVILSVILIVLITFYLIYYLSVSRLLKRQGNKIALLNESIIKNISEAHGFFRTIKLRGLENSYLLGMKRNLKDIRLEQFKYAFLGLLPKSLFELIIFLLLFVFLLITKDVVKSFELLTVFLVALYRLLPVFQSGFASVAQFKGTESSVDAIDKLFGYSNYVDPVNLRHLGRIEQISFTENFVFKNINYSYDGENFVLAGVNGIIAKGEKVFLKGKSGTGKSTLIDILSGLIVPTSGWLELDGKVCDGDTLKSWQRNVSVVHQKIFVLNESIRYNLNLVFGDDLKEDLYYIELLKKVGLWELVKGRGGLEFIMGEGGQNLSGGQLQRFAIARALLTDCEVIFFDEATSGLDKKSESSLINLILDLPQTVIFTTHNDILESYFDKTIIL